MPPTSKLDAVRDQLREQEQNVTEILSELQEQVSEYDEELKRIQGALTALNQKPKAGRKKRNSPSKPSASKRDVEMALNEVRQANPLCSPEEIRADAEKQLIEKGFSRSGLALRFKQASKAPISASSQD